MNEVYVNPFPRPCREEADVYLGATLSWVLAGDKSQFCRPIDPGRIRYASSTNDIGVWRKAPDGDGWQPYLLKSGSWGKAIRCPYGNVGGLLRVKESAKYDLRVPSSSVLYHFDNYLRPGLGNPILTTCWSSPIHMPRWAVRHWLRIGDIKIKRLHSLTDQEILAEGVSGMDLRSSMQSYWDGAFHVGRDLGKSRWAWQRGKQWRWYVNNPWVWVVSFTYLK